MCSRSNAVKNIKDDAFKEVITSCRSLNSFETNSLKSAIPQVREYYFLFVEFDIMTKSLGSFKDLQTILKKQGMKTLKNIFCKKYF
jgi:hypothetical protein